MCPLLRDSTVYLGVGADYPMVFLVIASRPETQSTWVAYLVSNCFICNPDEFWLLSRWQNRKGDSKDHGCLVKFSFIIFHVHRIAQVELRESRVKDHK